MIYNELGNTFTLSWPVTIEGTSTPMEDLDLTLYVVCKRFKKEMDFTVSDNTLTFKFEGKDQRVRGTYDLELYINEGENDQVILRQPEVFNIYK
jgi:hypothetical protein